jgi:hypothetical protein
MGAVEVTMQRARCIFARAPLHLDVRERDPDVLEHLDDEVVVLGGVEGQVAREEVLEVGGGADAVLRDHLLHRLPEVPPRVPRRLHHREALGQGRRLGPRRRRRARGRRGWLALLGRRDARGVGARLEAARRRHGSSRLELALLGSRRCSLGRVFQDVDVLVLQLAAVGLLPRRLGRDRRERPFRPPLGPQVDDDLRSGSEHLAVELVVGTDGKRRFLQVLVAAVTDEHVPAARWGVGRLDRHELGPAPAAAPCGRGRRGRDAAAAADRGGCRQFDAAPPVVAPPGRPARRR